MDLPLEQAMTETDAALSDRIVTAVAGYALSHGGRNIAALPGPWVHQVDDTWVIAINGHDAPEPCAPDRCMATVIAPYGIVAWYYGWLAGTLLPTGDGIFADGSEANLTTWLTALETGTPRPAAGGLD